MKLNAEYQASYLWVFLVFMTFGIVSGLTGSIGGKALGLLGFIITFSWGAVGPLYVQIKTGRLLDHRWRLGKHKSEDAWKYKVGLFLNALISLWFLFATVSFAMEFYRVINA